jgi:L-erythro-3,5-diaminohexanoate dehydrogenase
MSELIDALGAARVLEPEGALPQAAHRLDASPPARTYEIEIEVERLCLDSTSFRQLAEAADGDAGKIASSIEAIVGERGKMHNPVTGSGGILTGRVSDVGTEFHEPPPVGSKVVTLASLTLTPLRLEGVLEVDPRSPHVRARGTAYLPWTAPWTFYPDKVPFDAALAALDVCNASSQTRALIRDETNTVLVLGGGHGGMLALKAARESLRSDGRVLLMDADSHACQRARRLGLCDIALRADLRDAVGSLRALEDAGVKRADLTVVVVNASDCEATALLLTAEHGTVLFFSMATSFSQAALGAEGIASRATMLIGSGYAPDRGAYALELLAGDQGLREAMSGGG